MRNLPRILLFVAIMLAMAAGQSSPDPALPYTPSLDLNSMDKTVDPCVDFYQYSCGSWQKRNPIPPDETSWSVYGKLDEDNLNFLRGVLDQAAADKGERSKVTQEIGDFYAACMDETTIEQQGLMPIQADLDAIAGLHSATEITPLIARLQFAYGRAILFGHYTTQDPDDAEQQIAALDQGGLGLPDREYYLKQDAKSKEIREHYLQHAQKVLELIGDDPATANKEAATVLRMETALAEASLTRVQRRDPYQLKHKMRVADLTRLAPGFDWPGYFRDLQYPRFETLNVMAPAFFKEVNALLANQPVDNWKVYLRYHVADSFSPYLSSKFVDESFDFHLRYLHGANEIQPRWKRCVEYTDDNLGEALGQVYVSKVFSPELKQSTQDMVRRIEEAMGQRLRQLDWMSPATKQQALTKLAAILNRIGYPDKWRDYSSVIIARNDFGGDMQRAGAFEARREINKVGKPVDHTEWDMTPPTVNAGYDPQLNNIDFPAGVLQPPLYDGKIDDAPNYGDTGGTIGHELTHAFDDEGSQFDAKGNLKNWWTPQDRQRFDARTQCVQDQYSQYVAVDDVHLNGKLTLGENVADLGGEILAYMAWKDATKDKNLQSIDGLAPDQRFFIGFAQWACSNDRPEDERVRAATDPHSPAKYRVNGVVVNMPEFARAFSCKAGQPMVNPPEKVCKVW
jgi:putative endopeptidase